MLDGVRTEEELAHVREAGFAEWRDAAQPHLDALEAAVAACDGSVDDRLWLSGQVLASMSVDCVDGLIANPPDSLDSIGLQEELAFDGEGYNTPIAGTGIDGVELENMIQSGQFYGTGDDGEDSGWSVIVEGGRMWIGHPGFEDASGNARIHNCTASPGYPLSGPCTGQPTPNPGEAHKTAAASILLGNTTRGQDPTVTASVARRERSGVARSGSAVGIQSFTGSVLDNVVANPWYSPRVISRSSSTTAVSCTGTATHDIRANALFESGVALFNSNGKHGWATSCRLTSPGAALGTFTVGSYDTNNNDYALIRTNSSIGGALDGRTGMDMVAPQRFVYAYPHYDWPFSQQQQATFRYGTEWKSGMGPSWFGSSSAATPTIAGGAMLVRDWFRGQYGSAIDDPGLLYTHMLLMGNRSSGNGEPGPRMTSGFHDRWGAGKLRLRRLETDGLEAPAAYSSGSVCVDRNQSVIIPMANTNSDVDVIRAVAWWHDRGHDNGNGFGQVELALQRLAYCSGGACVYTVEGISASSDHKQRVHIDNPVADSGRSGSTVSPTSRPTSKAVAPTACGCTTHGSRNPATEARDRSTRFGRNDPNAHPPIPIDLLHQECPRHAPYYSAPLLRRATERLHRCL